MSSIRNVVSGRRLLERVSLIGLALFIGASIAAFGQAALGFAGLIA